MHFAREIPTYALTASTARDGLLSVMVDTFADVRTTGERLAQRIPQRMAVASQCIGTKIPPRHRPSTIFPNPLLISCNLVTSWHLGFMLARCSASSLSAVATALVLALPSSAAIVSLSALRDTTLYESATGALGNGSGQFLIAGTTNQPQLRRALLAFDLGTLLPANAIIESVTVTMHVASASVLSHNFSLSRVTAPWTEGASDAIGNEGSGTAAMTGDATWLHASWPGVAWSTAGGDFSTTSSAARAVGDVGFYSWTSAQLTSDVQSWLAHPTANFGWILRGEEGAPGTTRRFDSSESLDASLAPSLVIEYSVVPTPGSMALLALSLLVARRRRR